MTPAMLLIILSFISLISLSSPALTLAQTNDPWDQVYVEPFEELEGGLFGPSAREIGETFIDHNYQVHCAHPPSSVGLQLGGAYDRFVELELSQEIDVGFTTEAINVSAPLTVDDSSDMDWQTYFSNAKTSDNPYEQNRKTASYYKQLGLIELCEKQLVALEQIRESCDEINGDCPLNKAIPHSDFTTLQLWNQVEDLDCQDFSRVETMSQIPSDIRIALSNVPLNPPKNHLMVAFIIQLMEQSPTNNLFQRLLNWLIDENSVTAEVYTIVIPKVGLEHQPDEPDPGYNSPTDDLANFPQQPLRMIEEESETKNDRREEFRESFLAALNSGSNCGNCDEAIQRTLMAMIDGSDAACSQLEPEDQHQVGTDANLDNEIAPYTYEQNNWTPFESFVTNLFSQITNTFSTSAEVGAGHSDNIQGRNTRFTAYVVAPVDADPVVINNFFTPLNNQRRLAELDRTNQTTFDQGSIEARHSGEGGETYDFHDPEECDENGENCTNSFSANFNRLLERIGHPVTTMVRGNIENMANFLPFNQTYERAREVYESTIFNRDSQTGFYLRGLGITVGVDDYDEEI